MQWVPCAILSNPKGAAIISNWPCASYNFQASKAKISETHFIGLGIDEDRQPELTEQRIKEWCQQIHQEMCLDDLLS